MRKLWQQIAIMWKLWRTRHQHAQEAEILKFLKIHHTRLCTGLEIVRATGISHTVIYLRLVDLENRNIVARSPICQRFEPSGVTMVLTGWRMV